MTDSIERLFAAVMVAKTLDPSTSRTARLFRRGPSKMAKKVVEEAIEVAIDAVGGRPHAVIAESADLLYNLTALWAATGVQPSQVWAEMDRREAEQGIAEKLPKPIKPPKQASNVKAVAVDTAGAAVVPFPVVAGTGSEAKLRRF